MEREPKRNETKIFLYLALFLRSTEIIYSFSFLPPFSLPAFFLIFLFPLFLLRVRKAPAAKERAAKGKGKRKEKRLRALSLFPNIFPSFLSPFGLFFIFSRASAKRKEKRKKNGRREREKDKNMKEKGIPVTATRIIPSGKRFLHSCAIK